MLSGHEVRTTAEMGWDRLTNGELLDAAEVVGFEVLVTGDKGFLYQQRLAGRRIALVVLPTIRWGIVRAHAERIARAIGRATPGSYTEVIFDPQPRWERRPKGPEV